VRANSAPPQISPASAGVAGAPPPRHSAGVRFSRTAPCSRSPSVIAAACGVDGPRLGSAASSKLVRALPGQQRLEEVAGPVRTRRPERHGFTCVTPARRNRQSGAPARSASAGQRHNRRCKHCSAPSRRPEAWLVGLGRSTGFPCAARAVIRGRRRGVSGVGRPAAALRGERAITSRREFRPGEAAWPGAVPADGDYRRGGVGAVVGKPASSRSRTFLPRLAFPIVHCPAGAANTRCCRSSGG